MNKSEPINYEELYSDISANVGAKLKGLAIMIESFIDTNCLDRYYCAMDKDELPEKWDNAVHAFTFIAAVINECSEEVHGNI